MVGVIPTDNGDTGYMIICTALVLMMTIPGLGLYYSGMVRVQNVLVTIMQSFCIACVITIVWLCWGYSLAFSPAGMPNENGAINHSSSIIGDGRRLWLWGMNMGSVHQNAPTIPESVYCTYELAFAIITAALICGSFADRMRFGPMLVFIVLWHTLVYCPIAHWNWHPDGFLQKAGSLDFAGGNVVHISSGVAGMMCTIVIGNRKGYGRERFEPHNTLLTYFGCGLLWVGWYGFNAGSANAAVSDTVRYLASVPTVRTRLMTRRAVEHSGRNSHAQHTACHCDGRVELDGCRVDLAAPSLAPRPTLRCVRVCMLYT
jgi:Amt family ammonium transporter